jgi:amino acid adenylation domain-containing protein
MSTRPSNFPFSSTPQPCLAAKAEGHSDEVPDSSGSTRVRQIRDLPQLVAAQAASTPNAPALIAGSEVVTYGELNDRANKLAHRLIALGVGTRNPDNLVALCLDRSVTTVVCALAILKAGAAYLPLDPSYPAERLAFMLRDAQPRVLITRQALAEILPTGRWAVLAIDCDDTRLAGLPTDCPNSDITSEDLAYVIYTSGSTGQPKGVEITHGSLMNLVSWHQSTFEITSGDRASLLAGVGFDAAVWETWPYLAAGASIHLPDDCTRLSPELLRDWLVAEEITVSFLPTALAERVMTLEWPLDTSLRILLTGAEALRHRPSPDLPFKFVNNYGPTECTVVATSGLVSPNSGNGTVPTIGRPITNTDVYILDENLQCVPVGTAGELHIGGAGVARGYLNRPELTSEKFIRNPFTSNGPESSSRLYKTGDLARYLENGEIAYLGRIDDQIKILGHRIEPNEIVAVLNRHSGVQASVVIAREDAGSEKLLVAYVVPSSLYQLSKADLRSFLCEELPDYMVPATFVVIEGFSLTQNGKLDRADLPAPTVENTLRDEEFIAPRTPIEKRVAVMLSDLLGIDCVGVTDNFFMLGGHSLLGTQLISHIRSTFGVELALRTLFDAPTIEELAIEVERLLVARVEAMSEEEVLGLLA